MEDRSPLLYRRKSFKLEDFGKFKTSPKRFEQQYCCIYNKRLKALRDDVLRKARIKWANYDVVSISELSEGNDDKNCIIVGILYKHQELKPSILRELSEGLQLEVQPARTNYASFKDILYLEDEMLRVKLIANQINIGDVVTGIACAVLGHELENGAFSVEDWCFPGCCPKLSLPEQPHAGDGKILILSGLDIANSLQSLCLDLLSEWVTGMVGCSDTQEEVASIVCIIIAGNTTRASVETHNHKKYFETKDHQAQVFQETAIVTHRVDNFLCRIVQCCPILFMPGDYDPTCHALPQQSVHPCILPLCSRFKSFHGVTNPWVGRINSRIIAGSSGQPIVDIMNVNGLADVSPLVWLERTLLWRHYAPTAPDTVPAYPYSQADPFIMTECPDIYFAGNMEKFDTKLFTADEGQVIRLICIPKFSETRTGVLVNLHDLKTWPVSFAIN